MSEPVLITVMFLGLIAKSWSLGYVLRTLKVTQHIIRILALGSAISVVLQLISLVGKFWLILGGSTNAWECSLMHLPFPLSALNISILTLLVSFVRFHMANRTHNNLKIKHDLLKWATYLGFAFQSLAVPLALYLNYHFWGEVPAVVQNCMGGFQKEIGTPGQLVFLFWIVFGSMCFIAAFILDLKLALLIKKRSRVQPIRLIAWLSNPSQKIKTTIPLRSSFICLLYFGIVVAVGIFVPPSQLGSDCVVIFLAVAGSCYIPLILWLSIKSNEKVAKSCPPRILHGLDEPVNDESGTSATKAQSLIKARVKMAPLKVEICIDPNSLKISV